MQSFTINGNGSNNMDVKDTGSYSGLLISAVSTAVSPGNFNSQAVNVSAVVSRSGQQVQILNGNLYALSLGDNPANAENNSVPPSPTQTAALGFFIRFGPIVNLKQGDMIQISLTNNENANYTVRVTILDGVGVGSYTPYVNVIPVQTSVGQFNQQLGDNVRKVTLIHSGEDWIVTTAVMTSDIWQANYALGDMQALIATQYPFGAVIEKPNVILFDSEARPANGMTISCNTDPTAGGFAFLVVFSGVRTPLVSNRAWKMVNRHAVENRAMYFNQ